MRAAEYGIVNDARSELAVFYYGERSGTIDAHVSSWSIQFEQRDGSETKPKREELKVGPLAITTVEITGIFTGPTTTPGASVIQSDGLSALLGAIVSGPKGLVLFKLTGPRDNVERARPAFEQLVHSLRPE
jgi:hypothetical protein